MRLRHVRLARAMNVPGVGSTDAGRSVLQERNAAMMKTWMSLGHSEDALQFSEDGTQCVAWCTVYCSLTLPSPPPGTFAASAMTSGVLWRRCGSCADTACSSAT